MFADNGKTNLTLLFQSTANRWGWRAHYRKLQTSDIYVTNWNPLIFVICKWNLNVIWF